MTSTVDAVPEKMVMIEQEQKVGHKMNKIGKIAVKGGKGSLLALYVSNGRVKFF